MSWECVVWGKREHSPQAGRLRTGGHGRGAPGYQGQRGWPSSSGPVGTTGHWPRVLLQSQRLGCHSFEQIQIPLSEQQEWSTMASSLQGWSSARGRPFLWRLRWTMTPGSPTRLLLWPPQSCGISPGDSFNQEQTEFKGCFSCIVKMTWNQGHSSESSDALKREGLIATVVSISVTCTVLRTDRPLFQRILQYQLPATVMGLTK